MCFLMHVMHMHVILRVVVGDSRLPALALAQTSSVLLLPEDNRLDLLEFEVQRLRAHQTLGLKRGCRDPRRDPETVDPDLETG